MKKELLGCVQSVIFAGAITLAAMLPGAAQDTSQSNKQPSDRTVDFLKTFVEGFLIPEEIPLKDGTSIKVDAANAEQMKKFHIPRGDMRRVIRLAYHGANAEICDREDLQQTAYQWMKNGEIEKNKWSNEQLFFISRLYIATVMWQTGKAQVVVEGEETTAVNSDSERTDDLNKRPVCTEAKKENVRQLEAFLKEKTKG